MLQNFAATDLSKVYALEVCTILGMAVATSLLLQVVLRKRGRLPSFGWLNLLRPRRDHLCLPLSFPFSLMFVSLSLCRVCRFIYVSLL